MQKDRGGIKIKYIHVVRLIFLKPASRKGINCMSAADAVLEDRLQKRGVQDHCHLAPVHHLSYFPPLPETSLLQPNPGTLHFTNTPATCQLGFGHALDLDSPSTST